MALPEDNHTKDSWRDLGSVPVATDKGRSHSAPPHRAMDDASHSSTTISTFRDHRLVHIQFNGLPTATASSPAHPMVTTTHLKTKVSFTSLLPVGPGSFLSSVCPSSRLDSTRLTRLDSTRQNENYVVENPGSYHRLDVRCSVGLLL